MTWTEQFLIAFDEVMALLFFAAGGVLPVAVLLGLIIAFVAWAQDGFQIRRRRP